MAQVPAELAQRMREAARTLGGAEEPAGCGLWGAGQAARADWLIAQLGRLGEALLAEARSAPPGRRTALTLLAADAFMTYACEALAELAPERLGAFR